MFYEKICAKYTISISYIYQSAIYCDLNVNLFGKWAFWVIIHISKNTITIS